MVTSMTWLTSGCRTEPTEPSSNFSNRNTYSIEPKALLERVRTTITSPPINLKIDSQQEGRLITDWEMHDGAKFGVAGLGRTWQERTRYTVTVAPAWDDPTSKGSVEVTEETQQRPQPNHEWGDSEPVARPGRAAEFARRIDDALRAQTPR